MNSNQKYNIQSKELKAMAREQLSGHYGIYIGALCVYFMIYIAATFLLNYMLPAGGANENLSQTVIYYVADFIISLLLSVLSFGFNKMYLDGSRKYTVRFADLFYGFSHYPDRIILMQIVLNAISYITIIPANMYMDALQTMRLSSILKSALLLLAASIVHFLISVFFAISGFLLADYNNIGPIQALKESARLMKGYKGKYIYLELSFLGLYLLCFLTCGIGLLWLTPYIGMTHTNFYRKITGELDPVIPENSQSW